MKSRVLNAVVVFAMVFLLLSPAAADPVRGWPRGGSASSDRILASPLLADLDGDVRMEIVAIGLSDNVYVYNHDGTLKDGWPVTLGFQDGSIASPAVGDIDNDDQLEIVVVGDNTDNGTGANVKVYESTGALRVAAGTSMKNVASASGKATPCVVNCMKYDGASSHDALEILVRDGDGQLQALYWDSASLSNWYNGTNTPYQTLSEEEADRRDRYGNTPITPSVSALDLGGADTLLVCPSTNGHVCRWVVSSDGSSAWDFSRLSDISISGSPWIHCSASLAYLDAGNIPDAIVGAADGKVYAWNCPSTEDTPTTLTGWPKDAEGPVTASPAVAELDGVSTNGLEVVVGTEKGKVFAWHRDGTAVDGWPVQAGGGIFGSPVVAQLDQTPELEVVATALDGRVYVWSANGEILDKWPKRLGTQIYSSPAVGDIHNWGRMSIVVTGYDGRIYVFDLAEKSLDVEAGWRQFRGGPQRQGVVE
ncbi:VCBS repeat-containing protein [Candidatus Sumerlaeota bacterium]|nr:VCBS repeat-containing protein [Candidatus Sumerlaeota bacterium]